ncbi:MAG: type 2 periplasmic-binding domain-containing protein [Saccharofermentanales bacterium]
MNSVAQIRNIANELLANGEVEIVIGYSESSLDGKATPIFVSDPADTAKMIFNETCNLMLAKYLLRYKGKKIGIVAKPCDTRAIIGYMIENQVKREDIRIIGVSCMGMTGNRACGECGIRNPVLFDYKAGDDVDVSKLVIRESQVKEIEKLPADERWDHITKEFSKCIKCYACRQSCYMCYCNTCFVDRNQPVWTDKGTAIDDIMSYHLIRAMHTAGRCINCGICESTCPMGIDVRLLTSKIRNDSKELFGYDAGLDINEKPVITDFKPDDKQEKFIE